MKKLLFFLMVIPMAFISCSDSDDGDSGVSGMLVGKWEVVADYSLINGEWVMDNYESGVFEFLSNNIVKHYEGGELDGSLSYNYDSSKKIISFAMRVWYIQTLTSSELVVIEDEEFKIEFKRVN